MHSSIPTQLNLLGEQDEHTARVLTLLPKFSDPHRTLLNLLSDFFGNAGTEPASHEALGGIAGLSNLNKAQTTRWRNIAGQVHLTSLEARHIKNHLTDERGSR